MAAASSLHLHLHLLHLHLVSPPTHTPSSSSNSLRTCPRTTYNSAKPSLSSSSSINPLFPHRNPRFVCRAAEYKFPDPIPEFAEAEIEKFRSHLTTKLTKKEEIFGDSVEEVVEICTQILSKFLHTEYGGPGTLLVIPFIDMADTLNGKGLPGGPQAARAAVKWAQAHIDKDWKEWNTTNVKSPRV